MAEFCGLLIISAMFAWTIMVPVALLHGLIEHYIELPIWSPPLSAILVAAVFAHLRGAAFADTAMLMVVSGAYAGWFTVILFVFRDGPNGDRPSRENL